jgi:GNAT superfamily N-acetyltransferase
MNEPTMIENRKTIVYVQLSDAPTCESDHGNPCLAQVSRRWHRIGMEIRDATAEDAVSACEVLRRSITELCVADHRDDPDILARWLSNKNPGSFRSWLRPGNSVLVAVEGVDILAVGSVTDAGMITLNYVSPSARFRGVSRSLVAALEVRAIERGNSHCVLNSTETARRFYLANGYVDSDASTRALGPTGHPMSKELRRQTRTTSSS